MPDPVIRLRDADAAEKWPQILADLVTDPKELLKILELDAADLNLDPAVLRDFPLKIPRPFLDRIEKGNRHDPLLRQILPLNDELVPPDASASIDPLREADSNPLPGLLHKYHGRVLLTVAPHCAVHCRYCFRRHFDYRANTPGRAEWQKVIDYLHQDPAITEVIYSGGDPLAAGDRYLAWLTRELEQVPHLRRLRIHTRTPVVLPARVTDALLAWLTDTRLTPVLVIHANHARELDSGVKAALAKFTANGITLLNQSVLLKGVNDSLSALSELSETLFANSVLPYYLHLLDPVAGVRHFEVAEARGRELVQQMRDTLPGYLVPRLVRETAGSAAKQVIG